MGDALTHAVSIKDYNLTEKLLKYLKSKGLLTTTEMRVPFVDDDTLKMTRKIKRKIKRNLDHSYSGSPSRGAPSATKPAFDHSTMGTKCMKLTLVF